MRRVKAGLSTPITIVSATSGSNTASSRGDRSGSPWFFGFVELAEEDALHHPEHVRRRQDHAERGDHHQRAG